MELQEAADRPDRWRRRPQQQTGLTGGDEGRSSKIELTYGIKKAGL